MNKKLLSYLLNKRKTPKNEQNILSFFDFEAFYPIRIKLTRNRRKLKEGQQYEATFTKGRGLYGLNIPIVLPARYHQKKGLHKRLWKAMFIPNTNSNHLEVKRLDMRFVAAKLDFTHHNSTNADGEPISSGYPYCLRATVDGHETIVHWPESESYSNFQNRLAEILAKQPERFGNAFSLAETEDFIYKFLAESLRAKQEIGKSRHADFIRTK